MHIRTYVHVHVHMHVQEMYHDVVAPMCCTITCLAYAPVGSVTATSPLNLPPTPPSSLPLPHPLSLSLPLQHAPSPYLAPTHTFHAIASQAPLSRLQPPVRPALGSTPAAVSGKPLLQPRHALRTQPLGPGIARNVQRRQALRRLRDRHQRLDAAGPEAVVRHVDDGQPRQPRNRVGQRLRAGVGDAVVAEVEEPQVRGGVGERRAHLRHVAIGEAARGPVQFGAVGHQRGLGHCPLGGLEAGRRKQISGEGCGTRRTAAKARLSLSDPRE